MMDRFLCGKGCGRQVTGIYCPEHREQANLERIKEQQRRAEAMRERWKNNREQMLSAIAAGKRLADTEAENGL
jgi:hypothetical protein